MRIRMLVWTRLIVPTLSFFGIWLLLDLTTMTERIHSGYYSCLRLFLADFHHILNCHLYNEHGIRYFKCATNSEKFSMAKMKSMGFWYNLNVWCRRYSHYYPQTPFETTMPSEVYICTANFNGIFLSSLESESFIQTSHILHSFIQSVLSPSLQYRSQPFVLSSSFVDHNHMSWSLSSVV